jgi:hypothetical protein
MNGFSLCLSCRVRAKNSHIHKKAPCARESSVAGRWYRDGEAGLAGRVQSRLNFNNQGVMQPQAKNYRGTVATRGSSGTAVIRILV